MLQVPLTTDKCEPLLAVVAEKKEYYLQRWVLLRVGWMKFGSVVWVGSCCWHGWIGVLACCGSAGGGFRFAR